MENDSGERGQLPADAHVGRVALTVDDLDRVLPFYRDALGFAVERDGDVARLSASDRPLLVLVEDRGAPERPRDAAGLFHVAIRVPSRAALADALARIRDAGASLTGASDHLVSEALYLRDPAGNGVEVYRDRPREDWPRAPDGSVEMDTLPLDLEGLAADATGAGELPAGTAVGHVHLEVADLARAEGFYVEALGFDRQTRFGEQASFVGAGGYHHHVGLNTWNHRTSPAAGDARGLRWFEVVVPDAAALDAVRKRLGDRGEGVTAADDGAVVVTDPDRIQVRLASASER
ncbi:MAG: VOC family protein [Haloarculaceae archaeon]